MVDNLNFFFSFCQLKHSLLQLWMVGKSDMTVVSMLKLIFKFNSGENKIGQKVYNSQV